MEQMPTMMLRAMGRALPLPLAMADPRPVRNRPIIVAAMVM